MSRVALDQAGIAGHGIGDKLPANIFLPPTRGLRDWRRDMPAHDVAVFEVIAGRLLQALGYTRAASVPLAARIRILAQCAPDAVRSLRSRLR